MSSEEPTAANPLFIVLAVLGAVGVVILAFVTVLHNDESHQTPLTDRQAQTRSETTPPDAHAIETVVAELFRKYAAVAYHRQLSVLTDNKQVLPTPLQAVPQTGYFHNHLFSRLPDAQQQVTLSGQYSITDNTAGKLVFSKLIGLEIPEDLRIETQLRDGQLIVILPSVPVLMDEVEAQLVAIGQHIFDVYAALEAPPHALEHKQELRIHGVPYLPVSHDEEREAVFVRSAFCADGVYPSKKGNCDELLLRWDSKGNWLGCQRLVSEVGLEADAPLVVRRVHLDWAE